MTDIHFSDSTIFAIGLGGALMMILPVILFIVLKIKKNIPVKPVLVGAVTFFLFAIILKLPLAYLLYYADNPVAKEVNNNPWLYYLFGGLLAGVFEESGRFIAFKTILKKDSKRITSLAYGTGHGGFESLYVGYQMLTIIALAVIVNSGDTEQLTRGVSPQQTAVMEEQIRQYASVDLGYVLTMVFERATAMSFHMAMSFIVFKAAKDKKSLWLYPLAVVLHALLDFTLVFTKLGIPLFVFEIMLAVVSVLMLILSYKLVYIRYEEPDEKADQAGKRRL